MSFMLEIEAAAPSPIDRLAADYLALRSGKPSIDFCRRVLGAGDEISVARRLGVAITTVRGWREIGRRASRWSCE